jgi:methylenetetrahydrofolate reductase (NADPH)
VISLELVPRDLQSLLDEARTCIGQMNIDRINIPDIKRLPLRSHDAALYLAQAGVSTVPHVRVKDRPLNETLNYVDQLIAAGVQEILFVSGDVIPGIDSYDVQVLSVIEAVKSKHPSCQVYGGLDPYRQDLRGEMLYAKDKISAGCDALFTQPFFDSRLIEFWSDFFNPRQLWIGVAPVNSAKSQEYWEKTNKVPFAQPLDYSVAGCAELGRSLLATAEKCQQNAYLMPIRLSAAEYLNALAT